MFPVSCFWDGSKWWFVEHQFKYEDATFEINKMYSSESTTEYKFTLKSIPEDKRNFRLAIQWVRSNDQYLGMMFEMIVPDQDATPEQ